MKTRKPKEVKPEKSKNPLLDVPSPPLTIPQGAAFWEAMLASLEKHMKEVSDPKR